MSIPSWAAEYIGIPWLDRGRTRAGVDCWGLLWLVKGQQSGVWMPSYAEDYATAHDSEEIGALMRGEMHLRWKRIAEAEAEPLDALMITEGGEPKHPGVIVARPYFLNVLAGTACALEDWTSSRWNRRASFYRYVG